MRLTAVASAGQPAAELTRLLAVMAALRQPDTGCPWDVRQSFATIAPYTIEEAYEVADAIARHDLTALPDELGDLLFQVVYHARLAEEAGAFGFANVARHAADKMIRRHPHVFGAVAQDAALHAEAWEAQKQTERHAAAADGALAGVSETLPALLRAGKLCARAARVGFDWPDTASVLDKLDEEIAELRAELADSDPSRLADEVGDILFVVSNLARKLGLEPEACLRQANRKFARRFRQVERRLADEGSSPSEGTLSAMEAHWQAVKAAEASPKSEAQRT